MPKLLTVGIVAVVVALTCSLVLVLIAPLNQRARDRARSEPEAEELFNRMEKQCLDAESLQCTFEGKMEIGGKPFPYSGSLKVAKGNKVRLEYTKEMGGLAEKKTAIADGDQMVTISHGKRTEPTKAPKWLSQAVLTAFTRDCIEIVMPGWFDYFESGEERVPDDFKDMFFMSQLVMAGTQRLAGKEVRTVKYRLKSKGDDWPLQLLLDAESDLPIKRILTFHAGEDEVKVTETYGAIKLNEKIDEREFDIKN